MKTMRSCYKWIDSLGFFPHLTIEISVIKYSWILYTLRHYGTW